MQPGMPVSYVARRNALSPSLVFRWRRLTTESVHEAARAHDEVVPASDVRRLEDRVRELERHLGRSTLEVENPEGSVGTRVLKVILLSRSASKDDSQ